MAWTAVDKTTGQPTTLTVESWLATWADARKTAFVATWMAHVPGQEGEDATIAPIWQAFIDENNITMRDI
jgi:hypothetical protein